MNLRTAAYLAIAVAYSRKIVGKARGERPRMKVIFRSAPPPVDPLADLRIIRIIRTPINQSDAKRKAGYRIVPR